MTATPESHWEHTVNEWSNGQFSWLLNFVPQNINVVYDIGANVGGFTHVLHDRLPKAKFYCFEPVELNYKLLVERVPYATCFDVGIFYGATESRALWRGSNVGAFFVEHINSGDPRVESGMTMKLTELELLDIEKPDLIKMDIEGSEENVIANSSIVQGCPNLIVEWHPDHVDCFEFFKKYLPNHKIVVNLEDKQFLLSL